MKFACVGSILVLSGCSEYSAKNSPPSLSGYDSDTTGTPADTGTDTSSPLPEVEYYAVDLDFDLAYGAWESASLEIGLYTEELTSACVLDVPVLSATPVALPEEEPGIFAWWQVELGEGLASGPCPAWLPRSWGIGLGLYDSRLDPSMAAKGMLGYDVYGLYLQEIPTETSGASPIYIIGIGGTEEMLSGNLDLTVDLPPLPDARYRASSLLLMDLPQ